MMEGSSVSAETPRPNGVDEQDTHMISKYIPQMIYELQREKVLLQRKKSAVHLLNQVIQLVSSVLVQTAILCPKM